MLRPALLILVLGAAELSAQTPQRPAPAVPRPTAPAVPRAPQGADAVLAGTVFDSLRNVPLAGATVVVAGTSLSATTDDVGRFRFPLDSVPEGKQVIGFFHATLDSMGISAPTATVDVHHDGASILVELAVPSVMTVVRALCPDSALTEGRGAMLGWVRDAETDGLLSGAYVVVMWTGMEVGNSTVSRVPRALSTTSSADGSYHVCGLPPGTALRAQARTKGKASGWIDVSLGTSLLLIRNFLIGERPAQVAAAPAPQARPAAPPAAPSETTVTAHAPAAGGQARDGAPAASQRATPGAAVTSASAEAPAPLGHSVLTGTVVGPEGKPLQGALISLLGTQLSTRTDYRGVFKLGGMPAGTQTVEVRLLSYAPRRYTVDISPRHENRLAAILDERATLLEPVQVDAKATTNVPGFDDRRKRGFGSYVTRDDIEKRGSEQMTDLFRTIPGVQVMFAGGQYVIQMARAPGCSPQWYVDGAPFDATLDDMDKMFRPEDVEGIEVYKSDVETPPEFHGPNSACGTIVLWTRRGTPRKKPAGSH